ncbi:hypothetical protein F5B17DRAFT_255788 [Nemania serpens]|nr:hypothetical protein F5B17DRAFT_255788 [Nemania serpens]
MRHRPQESMYAGVPSRSRSNPRDGQRSRCQAQARDGLARHVSAAPSLNANENIVHLLLHVHSALSPETASAGAGDANVLGGFELQQNIPRLFEITRLHPPPRTRRLFCSGFPYRNTYGNMHVPTMGQQPRRRRQQQQQEPGEDRTGQRSRDIRLARAMLGEVRGDDEIGDDASMRAEAGVDEAQDTDTLVEEMGNLMLSSTTISTGPSPSPFHGQAPLRGHYGEMGLRR